LPQAASSPQPPNAHHEGCASGTSTDSFPHSKRVTMSRVVLFFLANSFPKMAQNENFFGGFQTPNMEISYRKIPILHEVPKGSPQYRRMFFFKKKFLS